VTRVLLIAPHHYNDPQNAKQVSLLRMLADANVNIRALFRFAEVQTDPPFQHKNMHWMQPFTQFGWREIPHLLKATHGYKPDVVQLVFDSNAPMSGVLFWFIPEFLKTIAKSKLVLQIVGSFEGSPPPLLKYWMSVSDAIVVDTEATERYIHSWSTAATHSKIAFVPTPAALPHQVFPEPHWVDRHFSHWIFSPGVISHEGVLRDAVQFLLPRLKADLQFGAVFEVAPLLQNVGVYEWLQQLKLLPQVALLAPLRDVERQQLLAQSDHISIRHLSVTDPRAQETVLYAVTTDKPIYIAGALFDIAPSLRKYSFVCRTVAAEIDPKVGPKVDPAPIPNVLVDEMCNTFLRIYQSL
jgi:hypothetical protein